MGERIQNFELLGEWRIANISSTAKAKDFSGRIYFLKKYSKYKMPRNDGSITPKGYEKGKKAFEEFTKYRQSINEALSSFAGTGGNIILPSKWFIHDIEYVEATEFINDVIDTEDVYKLPQKDINMIMLTATAALHNIHRKKVVHSDIKPQNVLVAKNSMGTITAKLIDFDISYFEDNVRVDDVGGSQNYISPEVACLMMTDYDPAYAEFLSTKSDIFSLGLLFHNLLTQGEFPKVTNLTGMVLKKQEKGDIVYCGEALACCETTKLVLSKKIKDTYLINLITNMIEAEPANRPTAMEVLNVLKNKTVMPTRTAVEAEETPEPTPTPKPSPTPTPTPKPSTDAIPTTFCEPWPEHEIEFNREQLEKYKYVGAVRVERSGKKMYDFYLEGGKKRPYTKEHLLSFGLAIKKVGSTPAPTPKPAPIPTPKPVVTTIDDGELWPEHAGYQYDMEAVKKGGYVSIAKCEKSGSKCYVLTKASGQQRIINFNTAQLFKYIIKK